LPGNGGKGKGADQETEIKSSCGAFVLRSLPERKTITEEVADMKQEKGRPLGRSSQGVAPWIVQGRCVGGGGLKEIARVGGGGVIVDAGP